MKRILPWFWNLKKRRGIWFYGFMINMWKPSLGFRFLGLLEVSKSAGTKCSCNLANSTFNSGGLDMNPARRVCRIELCAGILVWCRICCWWDVLSSCWPSTCSEKWGEDANMFRPTLVPLEAETDPGDGMTVWKRKSFQRGSFGELKPIACMIMYTIPWPGTAWLSIFLYWLWSTPQISRVWMNFPP